MPRLRSKSFVTLLAVITCSLLASGLFIAQDAKAAVSFVNSSSNLSTTASVSINMPTNVQEGDIMVAFVTAFRATNATAGDVTPPADWNTWNRQVISTRYKVGIFWRRASSTDAGPYSFTSASAVQMQGAIGAYRGCVLTGNPLDVLSNTGYITSNAIVRAATLTSTQTGGALIWAGWYYLSGTISLTAPGDFTSRESQYNTNNALRFADIVTINATTTGSKDGTAGATCTVKHAYMAALKPKLPLTLTQNQFRWYENVNLVDPTTALASENASTTLTAVTSPIRLRLGVKAGNDNLATATLPFKFQFSWSPTAGWTDVGATNSSAVWRFYDNTSVADKATVTSLKLTASDHYEPYVESNPATNTSAIYIDNDGEFDFALNPANATNTDYYFRLATSSDLDAYTRYASLTVSVASSVTDPVEFICIIDPDPSYNRDFSTLNAWEAAVQADLTSNATKVFSYTWASGTIANGANVTGQNSGATAVAVHQTATSTTKQIMLKTISGTFIQGEPLYVTGQPASNTSILLANAGAPVIAVAEPRSTNGTADTAAVQITGWTTSATSSIIIRASSTQATSGHLGKWDDSRYRLVASDGAMIDTIRIEEPFVTVDGLQLTNSYDDVNIDIIYAYDIVWQASYPTIKNNIIRLNPDLIPYSNSGSYGIRVGTDALSDIYIQNNIIYGFDTTNSRCIQTDNHLGGYTRAYNNTLYDCTTGIRDGYNDVIAVNNIVQSSADCFLNGFNSSSNYNICDINDSTGGVQDKTMTTVAFLDAANNDFHLAPTDTAARDAGMNLAFNASTTPYDIDGTARGGAWDIGADEVPVEYISTICESKTAGGNCNQRDYSGLSYWEDAVESGLTTSTTRVLNGSITGNLAENTALNVCNGGADTGIDAVVVATTSDQILIDAITGTSTPLVVGNNWTLRNGTCAAGNYWTATGTGDLLGASPIAIAKIDGSWTATDTAVGISGWVTDHDNYVRAYTTALARHNGKWDYGKYRIFTDAGGAWSGTIWIGVRYAWIDGLQLAMDHNGYAMSNAVWIQANGEPGSAKNNLSRISNSIIRGTVVGSGDSKGIGCYGNYDAANMQVWNNIIYDFESDGINCENDGDRVFVYNNTFYNNDDGLYTSRTVASNNISIGNRNNDYYVGYQSQIASSTNNVSSDSSATGAYMFNGTTGAVAADLFIDVANRDFHLKQTDTMAKDQGYDFSTNQNLFFTTDIDGQSRPFNDVWDIGADEYRQAIIYRSVGPDRTTPLYCGGGVEPLTINNSLLTINTGDGLPDNVGVGDAVVYNSSSSIAFISYRSSPTVYTLQSVNGSGPTTASGDTGWCVFRAYTSLSNAEAGNENDGLPNAVEDFDNWDGTGDYTDTDELGRDLVANNEQWNIACYGDEADDAAVVIDGWTTSASNYLRVYPPYDPSEVGAPQRHQGAWNDARYNLSVSWIWTPVIEINEKYVRIEGLQIDHTAAKDEGPVGILVDVYDIDSGVIISGNIITNSGNGTPEVSNVGVQVTNQVNLTLSSNIIYDYFRGYWMVYVSSGEYKIYNNTVFAGQYGIHIEGQSAGNYQAYNNIVEGAIIDYDIYPDSGMDGTGYNISSDNTSPNAAYRNKTAIFWDPANHNYHLSPEDTAALDQGTSSVSAVVMTDIDGTPIHTYDIGADDGSRYFEASIKETDENREFSTLSGWENGVNSDLTATTTLVFRCSSLKGDIADGATVIGSTSRATAVMVSMATSTSQVLLRNIVQGTSTSQLFTSGEKVHVQNGSVVTNYCYLSDAGNPAIAVAKIDGAWVGADSTYTLIQGWATGKYNYIKAYTTPTARHLGVWNSNKYRMARGGTCIDINGPGNVRIEGLQFSWTGTWSRGIYFDSAERGNYYVDNNIFAGSNEANNNGIFSQYGSWSYQNISNNIFYGASRGITTYGGATIINNTITNCSDNGIWTNSSYYDLIVNNIVDCSGLDYNYDNGWNSADANNISSDGTAPGTNSKTYTTVAFLDAANQDYHLAPTDTAARNAGTSSLSFVQGEGWGEVGLDIDGTSRGGAFDIGADEVPVEYISTICQSKTAGGDCNQMDYARLYDWEDKVETNLTATSTRVFNGYITGNLLENDVVTLYRSGSWLAATGTVVATTSDQILIDNIYWTQDPVIVANNDQWRKNSSNYWTATGTGDLLGASPLAVAKIDGAWTASDTAVVGLTNWLTDVDNGIRIYTTDIARHPGKWDYTKYRLYVSTAEPIRNYEAFVHYDGLQIMDGYGDNIFSDFSANSAYSTLAYGGKIQISNNIFRGDGVNSDNAIVNFNHDSSWELFIWNNLFYDYGSAGSNAAMNICTVEDCMIFNNTMAKTIAAAFGIRNNGGNMIAYNNLASTTGACFYGTYNSQSDYNACNGTDTTDTGTHNKTSVNYQFVDFANNDFHLAPTDTALRDAGYPIYASATLPSIPSAGGEATAFDIDGTARGAAFDIGADELATEFESVICETTSAGGSCATRDYARLTDWESNVGSDLTASTTRIFSGAITGNLLANDTVTMYYSGNWLTATGTVVATTTDQILVKNIYGTTSPIFAVSGIQWRKDSSNYWTIAGAGDQLGASPIAVAKIDGSWVASDTAAVTVDGWTSDPDNYIKIYTAAAARHAGKWDFSKYRLEAPSSAFDGFRTQVGNIHVDGLQILHAIDASNSRHAAYFSGTTGDTFVTNNIVAARITTGSTPYLVYVYTQGDGYTYLVNNIIYGTGNTADLTGIFGANVSNIRAYNNTVFNNYIGVWKAFTTGIMVMKNNLVASSSMGSYAGTFSSESDYNSTNRNETLGGSNDRALQTFSFVSNDQNWPDLHLAGSDTGALHRGVSLSSDPYFPLSLDIDGDTRPAQTTPATGWDIGADEWNPVKESIYNMKGNIQFRGNVKMR